jgi:hypothetical protein
VPFPESYASYSLPTTITLFSIAEGVRLIFSIGIYSLSTLWCSRKRAILKRFSTKNPNSQSTETLLQPEERLNFEAPLNGNLEELNVPKRSSILEIYDTFKTNFFHLSRNQLEELLTLASTQTICAALWHYALSNAGKNTVSTISIVLFAPLTFIALKIGTNDTIKPNLPLGLTILYVLFSGFSQIQRCLEECEKSSFDGTMVLGLVSGLTAASMVGTEYVFKTQSSISFVFTQICSSFLMFLIYGLLTLLSLVFLDSTELFSLVTTSDVIITALLSFLIPLGLAILDSTTLAFTISLGALSHQLPLFLISTYASFFTAFSNVVAMGLVFVFLQQSISSLVIVGNAQPQEFSKLEKKSIRSLDFTSKIKILPPSSNSFERLKYRDLKSLIIRLLVTLAILCTMCYLNFFSRQNLNWSKHSVDAELDASLKPSKVGKLDSSSANVGVIEGGFKYGNVQPILPVEIVNPKEKIVDDGKVESSAGQSSNDIDNSPKSQEILDEDELTLKIAEEDEIAQVPKGKEQESDYGNRLVHNLRDHNMNFHPQVSEEHLPLKKSTRPKSLNSGIPVQRIAQCMVGSARTLNYYEVHHLYKTNAIDSLRPHNVTLFIVTDLLATSHGIETEPLTKQDYVGALKHLNPEYVEWGDGPYSGLIAPDHCGYSKYFTCAYLVEEYEKKHRMTFDYVIKTRPDLLVLAPFPPIETWPTEDIWINPYYELSFGLESKVNLDISNLPQEWRDVVHPSDNENFGISDLFGLIPRKFMNVYFRDILRPDLPVDVCGERRTECECKLKASLAASHVRFQVSPVIVKLRRGFAFCSKSGYNPFNTVC